MPVVPMLMPSETVMVPKMIDLPPAASAPAAASRASWSMCMLHGVTMLQVEAMPTIGLAKSASWKPTARSIERLGARSGPSTTTEEWARRDWAEDLELMTKSRSEQAYGNDGARASRDCAAEKLSGLLRGGRRAFTRSRVFAWLST